MESISPEKDLHIRGTLQKPGCLSFWLTQPRPVGVSYDEWEAETSANWDRIFGSKEPA
jgi:quinol monooxygenase YgiN